MYVETLVHVSLRRPAGVIAAAALLAVSISLAAPDSRAGASASATASRDPLDIRLFARVPDPGQPEGIAIEDDGTVFVGTSPKEGGPSGRRRRSKVFAYDRAGRLDRQYRVTGQDLEEPFYGLVGMALDGAGRLYAADIAPPRIIRLDPRTGVQRTYATFEDVPPCRGAPPRRPCSATELDMAPLPDYPVFARDGTMYVTDLSQALIWRVPRGGGKGEVWFTDPGLETLFGPNGIQFEADGRTLLFALSTFSNPSSPVQRSSGLYELPVRVDGSPGRLRQLWEAGMADVPDGFALGRSGRAYVALAGTTGNSIAVISPQGQEFARAPASELENHAMEVPFDQPASVAFLGRRVLVTNQSTFARNEASYAVLDVFVGERGLPLFRPRLGSRRPRLRAEVRPRRATAGRRTCFRFRVRGRRGRPVRGARVHFAGRRRTTNRLGQARVCVRFGNPGLKRGRVTKGGFRPATVRVRLR
jgi:sugar lactone lactonase YvrE